MKDVIITFKVSESEKALIKAKAAEKDIPVSQLIREAIRQYIQQEG